MGVVASAYLFFGYAPPADRYGRTEEFPGTEDGQDIDDVVMLAHFGETKRWSDLGGLPVQVMHTGHYDYPGWCLCFEESQVVVDWAETKIIDSFAEPEGARGALREFCEKVGIDYDDSRVGWILATTYG